MTRGLCLDYVSVKIDALKVNQLDRFYVFLANAVLQALYRSFLLLIPIFTAW